VRTTLQDNVKRVPQGLAYLVQAITPPCQRHHCPTVIGRLSIGEAFVLVVIVGFCSGAICAHRDPAIAVRSADRCTPVRLVAGYAAKPCRAGVGRHRHRVDDAIVVVEKFDEFMRRRPDTFPGPKLQASIDQITAQIIANRLGLLRCRANCSFTEFQATLFRQVRGSRDQRGDGDRRHEPLTWSPALWRVFLRPHQGRGRNHGSQ